MVVRLRVASWLPQVPLAKRVAAWSATSSQVEGASTEAEAEVETGKAWKPIDQLS